MTPGSNDVDHFYKLSGKQRTQIINNLKNSVQDSFRPKLDLHNSVFFCHQTDSSSSFQISSSAGIALGFNIYNFLFQYSVTRLNLYTLDVIGVHKYYPHNNFLGIGYKYVFNISDRLNNNLVFRNNIVNLEILMGISSFQMVCLHDSEELEKAISPLIKSNLIFNLKFCQMGIGVNIFIPNHLHLDSFKINFMSFSFCIRNY